jgi:hypothetical protein
MILLAAAEAARRMHDSSVAEELQVRIRHAVESLPESITEPSLPERFLASKPIRDIQHTLLQWGSLIPKSPSRK